MRNEYAYVVLVHWLLQTIFRILDKDDDDGWDYLNESFVESSLILSLNWNIGCLEYYRRKVVKPESDEKEKRKSNERWNKWQR